MLKAANALFKGLYVDLGLENTMMQQDLDPDKPFICRPRGRYATEEAYQAVAV